MSIIERDQDAGWWRSIADLRQQRDELQAIARPSRAQRRRLEHVEQRIASLERAGETQHDHDARQQRQLTEPRNRRR